MGRCAQCLHHVTVCKHIDFTTGDNVTQCNNMVPLSKKDWVDRYSHCRFFRLFDSVGVINGQIAFAPWLRKYVPQG